MRTEPTQHEIAGILYQRAQSLQQHISGAYCCALPTNCGSAVRPPTMSMFVSVTPSGSSSCCCCCSVSKRSNVVTFVAMDSAGRCRPPTRWQQQPRHCIAKQRWRVGQIAPHPLFVQQQRPQTVQQRYATASLHGYEGNAKGAGGSIAGTAAASDAAVTAAACVASTSAAASAPSAVACSLSCRVSDSAHARARRMNAALPSPCSRSQNGK